MNKAVPKDEVKELPIYRLALVIIRFRVQYDQYFASFSYFANLFHEPLGE